MDLSTLMPQQLQIVKTLDRPLFVSAGAGSGKTFTLTRRIVYALSPESGPFVEHLDQVLAITFTKDAAAEIRDRVRRALIDEGMDEEALTVDDAWISTIHGMCSRILRAHPFELWSYPEVTVLTDTDELMDQAVEHVLGRATAPDAAPELAASLKALYAWYPMAGEGGPFGAGTTIKGLVRDLLELSSQLPGGMDDVRVARGQADTSALADAYRAALGASKATTEKAQVALDAIDAFEASGKTMEDAARLMMSCSMPRASKAFPKEQVELLKAEAADAFINIVLACGGPALDALVGLARAVEAEYRALKADQSALDNNDLLRMAYEALRDYPAIRAAYEGRFKMVMIDEFQDTDQMQVDLIRYLTGAGERALCTVGDAQQSIYRFRGAEVEVFRRQERKVGSSAAPETAAASDAPAGELVKLVRNFRSHDEVLRYVARVFDGDTGGLMQGFLDLEPSDKRKDKLKAKASRRQALFVAGGSTQERTQAKARAIAERFQALVKAGQPQGDMVLLLGRMTNADVYAQAFRDQGLDCVIAGGSVFAQAAEVQTVRALVCALANPADTAQGLMPLLASPMFALGAQEFLALATKLDEQTGETSRRNIDAGIMSDSDVPGLQNLPLVTRAREVLRYALRRVGRDSFAAIARDVVNASGWFVRLAQRGPEGKAIAANVLKALDAVAEAEAEFGNSPRSIALAFDRFLAGKEAPGALNEEGDGAVRIMTVHASKGLEYPVVAVAECFGVRKSSGAAQMGRVESGAQVVALPARFDGVKLADGTFVKGDDVKKQFEHSFKGKGTSLWLPPELMEDVCATGSPAEAFARLRNDDLQLSLEERARLFYVAMTRARELVILAMDAGVSRGKVTAPTFDVETDLTYDVLRRIFLPRPQILLESCSSGGNRFDCGMLWFSPQIWCSDDTDPVERLRIQQSLSFLYPPSCFGTHVSASPHAQTLRHTPLSTRGNVSLFGCLGYELDLTELLPVEQAEIRAQTEFYRAHRRTLQYGRFTRGRTDGGGTVWQMQTKQETVAAVFHGLQPAAPGYEHLCVTGLDGEKQYRLTSRPQLLRVGDFGTLLRHVLPVKLNPNGLAVQTADSLYRMSDGSQSLTASGAAFAAGICLAPRFSGTGYDPDGRMQGDFGSNVYFIQEVCSHEKP